MRSLASNRTVVGLDIEPGSISAAEIRLDGGRPHARRGATIALPPGVIRDGEVADGAQLTEALRELWSQNKGLGRRVRLGVANQRIVMRHIELPQIEHEKDLAAAVQFAAQDALPMALDQAVLDYRVTGTIDTPHGPRLRVMVVAARREMVERALNAVRDAGLKVEGIDLSAFAMVRALSTSESERALYLAVGGMTNLAVADHGICTFTRVSGAGLEEISIGLAERRALTLEHARAWLHHVGLDQPLEEVEGDPVIVADARGLLLDGARRISGEVRTSLDFHQAQAELDASAAVDRVVLTGPAATIPGFAAALSRDLAMPVEVGAVEADGDDLPHAAMLTVAAGVAVEGAPGTSAVNLIPAEERRGAGTPSRSGGAAHVLVGAMCALFLMATLYGLASREAGQAEDEVAALNQNAVQAEAQAAALKPYTEFADTATTRVATVTTLLESRYPWDVTLGELARVVPKGVRLVSIKGTSASAVTSAAPTAAGGSAAVPSLLLVGCAPSQSAVARLMARLRAIEGVAVVTLTSSTKGAATTGSAAAAGGGASASDCRGTSSSKPQFTLDVKLQAPGGTAAPTAAGTTAPAAASGAAATSPAAPATGGTE